MQGDEGPGLEHARALIAADARRMLALPSVLADQGFVLRLESEADAAFLCGLYVSTRWEELAPVTNWTEAQKREFLAGQFAAQRRHYLIHYAGAERSVIEDRGVACGRIYVERTPGKVHVVDLSLLPEWRGRGIGTALLQAVLTEAGAAGKRAGISVEKFNPAQRLYRRLGFREVEDLGVYLAMEWSPPPES
jgi:ribosomal protein S18 acetylase RimI-like enzyme